jgi:hypothetical protein
MQWIETLVERAHANLGDREREALWMRGVSDEQIDLFQLGYLDCDLPSLDQADNFLSWCSGGSKLDDVFVIPLTNTLGQVRGLQFRHVEKERTGYMDYMPYEDEPIFFGLAQAMTRVWNTKAIWIVEGAFDVFPIHRVIANVIATLTARVTTQLVGLLRRLVDVVWLGYDMDEAGRRACAQFVRKYDKEFVVHVVEYPRVLTLGGKGRVKDPSDLWEVWGDKKFGAFLMEKV